MQRCVRARHVVQRRDNAATDPCPSIRFVRRRGNREQKPASPTDADVCWPRKAAPSEATAARRRRTQLQRVHGGHAFVPCRVGVQKVYFAPVVRVLAPDCARQSPRCKAARSAAATRAHAPHTRASGISRTRAAADALVLGAPGAHGTLAAAHRPEPGARAANAGGRGTKRGFSAKGACAACLRESRAHTLSITHAHACATSIVSPPELQLMSTVA